MNILLIVSKSKLLIYFANLKYAGMNSYVFSNNRKVQKKNQHSSKQYHTKTFFFG